MLPMTGHMPGDCGLRRPRSSPRGEIGRLLGIDAVTFGVSACIWAPIMASVSVTTSIAPPNHLYSARSL